MTVHTPQPSVGSPASLTNNAGKTVVLLNNGSYGGVSNFLNDTWTFTGTDWTQQSPGNFDSAGPLPLRTDAAMSYDGYNAMLFGGRGQSELDGVLGDTWTWNGTVWAKQTTAVAPPNRFKHELAYLAGGATPGAVLFGGRNVNDMFVDTWIWNGTVWSQVTVANGAGPAGRTDACFAASPTAAILFGGSGTNSQFNDTWSFNGTAWSALSPATSPSVRSGACMSYDSSNSVWVMFGGRNEYGFLPETWTFNGTTWTQRSIGAGPAGRFGASMAFDTTSHTTIMFGGNTATQQDSASSETWSFNGSTFVWTQL